MVKIEFNSETGFLNLLKRRGPHKGKCCMGVEGKRGVHAGQLSQYSKLNGSCVASVGIQKFM